MTKAEAFYNFFSSFGIDAYEEDSVPQSPNAPSFPYITYSLVLDSFGRDTSVTANIWYRNRSGYSAIPDLIRKVDDISRAVGRGGVMIRCDGGAIWIRRGAPFSQIMGDPEDELIKRAYINLTAETLTAD